MATEDANPTDVEPTDAGPTDAGPTDAGPTDATFRPSLWARGLIAYLGLSLSIGAVWMTVTFGARVLAGAGWVGAPGRFEVVECVDVESPSADRGVVRTHYCTGTFHPDDGGPEIEDVTLKGGWGEAYTQSRRGSWCDDEAFSRTASCADTQTSLAARYFEGDAWIFGTGLWVPGAIAVLGLCGFGLSTLLVLYQLVWPDPERRPRRLGRRLYDFTAVGGIAFVVMLIALACEVNS